MSLPDAIQIEKSILRAADIRGVAGLTLTEKTAEQIGKAFGTVLVRNGLKKCVVGGDGRLSTPALSQALKQGLLSCGIDVISIGCCPTPMLYFAAYLTDHAGGIMVTASHNPKEYNGFKMQIDRKSFCGEDIKSLGALIQKQDFEQLRAQSEALKSVMNDKTFKDPNPLLIVQLRDIEKERLKIENQRRIMEKHRQLKAEQEEWRAKKDALTLMEQPHKQKYTYWDGKQNVIVEETISDTARYQKQLQAYDKDNERLRLATKNTMNELNRIEGTIDEISKKRAENEKLRYDNDFMKNYLQQREAEVLTPEFKQHMSEIAGEKVKLEREREIQQHMEDIHKLEYIFQDYTKKFYYMEQFHHLTYNEYIQESFFH